jgi:hypothetical protein
MVENFSKTLHKEPRTIILYPTRREIIRIPGLPGGNFEQENSLEDLTGVGLILHNHARKRTGDSFKIPLKVVDV